MNYEEFNKGCFEEAKRLYKTANAEQRYILEKLFPELKEIDDEKIRKELIAYFEENDENGYVLHSDRLRWVAWLEKYKYTEEEMKTILQTEYEKGRADVIAEMQKPVNKVEPKFKVGDWCIDNEDNTIFQIVKVLDNTYTYKTTEDSEYSCTHYSLENDAKLWTIQDAKDGDVLATEDSVFIFKYTHYEVCKSYCEVIGNSKLGLGFEFSINGVYPATKEQRNLLFQKMREAGYEWDAESRKLKKIHVIDEGKSEMDYCFTKTMNGKKINPAWSEEDERMYKAISIALSLKNPEGYLKSWYITPEDADNWLKLLKERYTWKPSDEQIAALSDINITGCVSYAGQGQELINLYNDLKKLRG